jgi:hypothetical protein
MTRDFTLIIYRRFLEAAIKADYRLTSFAEYLQSKNIHKKILILRQDVDKLPIHSLRTATLQYELGVKGTYYFRIVKGSFHPAVIEKIAALGHEIGYHYEDVSRCHGNLTKAFEEFNIHLEWIRRYYPVQTVCMHGSPLSKWDNRLLWTKYNYRDLGIAGEPYLDVDFNRVLYITDTGRSWNNSEVSVRDKVITDFQFKFGSTEDIIRHFNEKWMPDQIMQNIHPQRWSDDLFSWTRELFFQNVKNIVKSIVVKEIKSSY